MKRKYIRPEMEMFFVNMEHSVLITFSQVDNDGDGKTDQQPIIDGDPEGGIGAKRGWFSDDFGNGGYNPWKD
ncbi:hypothetical protein PRBRB14_14530 [Hallella multisaccharivorax DSM 17128]|uniref:Uncharacterized protein n=1 Tax=Hallella multisaccharivorax DSM 17128 TaxID=688246 RepID=F8NCJ7_9BACT|nr:hypothetical protein [Hallella multisaccharivorax]EGN57033.1 hypothetical protein Premu_1623 [Hallella multisaccharivorax DSM 17128]GJG30574.1 hypothetical protein PRBRB14_14530 [Hallella multisaccharivorax DSM 17128]